MISCIFSGISKIQILAGWNNLSFSTYENKGMGPKWEGVMHDVTLEASIDPQMAERKGRGNLALPPGI